MTLEDHLGDIIRKARLMAKLDAGATAQAAGLSAADYAALEDAGKPAGAVNFSALGALLHLNPARLEGIARGWLPPRIDTTRWREFRQITTDDGGMAVHNYLVWDEVTRDAAAFDTGWKIEPVARLIEENGLTLRHIFITHTHHDHIAALEPLRNQYPRALLHTDTKGAPPQHRNRRNDCIQLGSLRITNRDTPGHVEDGVTYLVGNWPDDAPHVAIVGDAIFAGSMGGAKEHGALARQKVREQILTLPADTLICPGHGPLTTVGLEKQNNPFFG